MKSNSSFVEAVSKVEHNHGLTPYLMFKYAVKTDPTRKYYERRLKRFFDFIEFETNENDFETRCNTFAEKAISNTNCTLSQVIRFLQYQKERVENKEITTATLNNFVKSIKYFVRCLIFLCPRKDYKRSTKCKISLLRSA